MDEDVAFPTPVGLANEVRELVGRTHKHPSRRPQDPSLLSDRVHHDVNSPNIWSRGGSLIISHQADDRAACGTQRFGSPTHVYETPWTYGVSAIATLLVATMTIETLVGPQGLGDCTLVVKIR